MRVACQAKLRDQEPSFARLRELRRAVSAARAAKTGAGGENRTHDLPLTKGLRYHYATPATEAFVPVVKGENAPGRVL